MNALHYCEKYPSPTCDTDQAALLKKARVDCAKCAATPQGSHGCRRDYLIHARTGSCASCGVKCSN